MGLGYFLLLINVIDISLLFQRKGWANVLCMNQHSVSSTYIYICFCFSFFDISLFLLCI